MRTSSYVCFFRKTDTHTELIHKMLDTTYEYINLHNTKSIINTEPIKSALTLVYSNHKNNKSAAGEI